MSGSGTTKPRTADVFPATQLSWIDERLEQGEQGRSDVNRHIMELYRFPLSVYYLGTRDRWLGDVDEVINGFFADRLARTQFLGDWRASGLKLRQWLINAFCFYLRELKRARRRDAHEDMVQADEMSIVPSLAKQFDKALVSAMVRKAMNAAQQDCEKAGLAAHWQVFVLHFCHGRPYDQFAGDLGVDAARAVVMARTAKKKFQTALRDIVACDSQGDVDTEIRSLLESS